MCLPKFRDNQRDIIMLDGMSRASSMQEEALRLAGAMHSCMQGGATGRDV